MNSATVSWTPGGDETNWNVEYKEATATTWTVVPVTTTTYTINKKKTGNSTTASSVRRRSRYTPNSAKRKTALK